MQSSRTRPVADLGLRIRGLFLGTLGVEIWRNPNKSTKIMIPIRGYAGYVGVMLDPIAMVNIMVPLSLHNHGAGCLKKTSE